jgi:hypothetical protein
MPHPIPSPTKKAAACERIRETLGDEEMEADAPCACHRDEAVP